MTCNKKDVMPEDLPLSLASSCCRRAGLGTKSMQKQCTDLPSPRHLQFTFFPVLPSFLHRRSPCCSTFLAPRSLLEHSIQSITTSSSQTFPVFQYSRHIDVAIDARKDRRLMTLHRPSRCRRAMPWPSSVLFSSLRPSSSGPFFCSSSVAGAAHRG